MVLSDGQIIERIRKGNMIVDALVKAKEEGIISAGVSSSGYDLRCGYTFYVFKNRRSISPKRVYTADDELPHYVLDPKNVNTDLIETVICKHGDRFILHSGEYALVPAIEYLKIPRDIVAVVLGKSTYARNGLIINCTPAESEWEGHLTIEISNPTPLDVVIYPGEGICQLLFFEINGEVLRSYADKEGKYQYQEALSMLSKIKR